MLCILCLLETCTLCHFGTGGCTLEARGSHQGAGAYARPQLLQLWLNAPKVCLTKPAVIGTWISGSI